MGRLTRNLVFWQSEKNHGPMAAAVSVVAEEASQRNENEARVRPEEWHRVHLFRKRDYTNAAVQHLLDKDKAVGSSGSFRPRLVLVINAIDALEESWGAVESIVGGLLLGRLGLEGPASSSLVSLLVDLHKNGFVDNDNKDNNDNKNNNQATVSRALNETCRKLAEMAQANRQQQGYLKTMLQYFHEVLGGGYNTACVAMFSERGWCVDDDTIRDVLGQDLGDFVFSPLKTQAQ